MPYQTIFPEYIAQILGPFCLFFLISHSSQRLEHWSNWFLLHNFISFLLVSYSVNSSQTSLEHQLFSAVSPFCLQSNLFFCLLMLISTCFPMHFEQQNRSVMHIYDTFEIFCFAAVCNIAHYYTLQHILWCHSRPQFAHTNTHTLMQLLSLYYVRFSYICFILLLILPVRLP